MPAKTIKPVKEKDEIRWNRKTSSSTRSSSSSSSSSDDREYEVRDASDRFRSSLRGSGRFELIENEVTGRNCSPQNLLNEIRSRSKYLVIHPDSWFEFYPSSLSLIII
ncbi:potassium channel SKOR-like [Senna tora]|uniref:Potassium channel SKOR-like n=1 Tax=Senna tora TaxID=362788 RepID=A0A834U4I4_9FABA|nr:potassium channel SKOR-like [Senna tora]